MPSAIGLLDSGTFSDPIEQRITPEQALVRQLDWETRASKKLGIQWNCQAIASYDFVISKALRLKNVQLTLNTKTAIDITVDAAKYLASQRQYLKPRRLILGCQGINTEQYYQCVLRVLEYADDNDWLGLGGWTNLGMNRSLLPSFHEILHRCIPLIATSGVCHIHLYGVLLEQALAPLLFLADRYQLTVSCDSNRPLLDLTRRDFKRAGVRANYWRHNIVWWQKYCASLRSSKFYREPVTPSRQLIFDLNLQ